MLAKWQRPLILALAANQLLQGVSLALAPGQFYDAVANFGPRNDHFLRDAAAFPLASAICLFVAAGRPSWRVPVLALVALQYLFHTVNHLVDIGGAEPGWVGPLDFFSLALIGVLAAALWRQAAREDSA